MTPDNDAFRLDHKARIEAGAGCIENLSKIVAGLVGRGVRILLVSDRGVQEAGLTKPIVGMLGAAGHEVWVAADLAGEPDAAIVDATARTVRGEGIGLVVGLGGGSALDLAKLASSLAAGSGDALRHAMLGAPLPEGVPVVAIPTTAGTGAEVTRTAVFSGEGRKLWAFGEALRPAVALLDPELTLGLPPRVTALGGLDAIVHGVEAATNRRRNPVSIAYGLHAVRLAARALPRCIRRPDDLAARSEMLTAACLAGLAIDIAGTGAAHALGHALGSVRHLPHGLAVTLGLRACLAWNAEGERGRHRDLASTLGITADGSLPSALGQWFDGLIDRVGVRDLVREAEAGLAGARPELAASLAAEENRPMLDANARRVGESDRALLLDRLTAV